MDISPQITPNLEHLLEEFLTEGSLIHENVRGRLAEISLIDQFNSRFLFFLNPKGFLPQARKTFALRRSRLLEIDGRLNQVRKLFAEYGEIRDNSAKQDRQQELATALLLNWCRILTLKYLIR